PREDASRSALDFIHAHLLNDGVEQEGLDRFLDQLAVAFRAAGAGLATFEPAGPTLQGHAPAAASSLTAVPWHSDATWLRRASPATGAVRLPGPKQTAFLVAAWESGKNAAGLLWLDDDAGRIWSAAESAALDLAAALLGRRFGRAQNHPRWAAQVD